MSISAVFSGIYDVVDSMTIANSFSADWVTYRGGDEYFNSNGKNRFTAVLISEQNIDREENGGGGSQGEYTNRVEIEFHGRIPMKKADINPSEVPFETMLEVLSGIEDIKKAFEVNSPYIDPICSAGAYDWYYEGHEIEYIEQEEKFSVAKAILTYQFYYRTTLIR